MTAKVTDPVLPFEKPYGVVADSHVWSALLATEQDKEYDFDLGAEIDLRLLSFEPPENRISGGKRQKKRTRRRA